MRASLAAGFWLFLALSAVVVGGFPAALTLERAFPATGHGLELSQLRERDGARHRRFLQSSSSSSSSGVVDLPVEGTYDPYLVGLYFTRVKLGSPPKEFYVQIDTGSDVLWVSCDSCNGCPTSSGLEIPLNFFNPSSSSTASLISCSDQRCVLGADYSDSGCSTQNNQCSYSFKYGDGSGTSGYYVSDVMYLNLVVENSLTSNSSAPIVFGLALFGGLQNSCSTSQTGDLTQSDRAVNGIFGFGQRGLSVISQLSSQGVTPNSFSHCLKGENGGGGILVFGEIVHPNIVYSPLVPLQPHYNLNLQSIAVDGKTLAIDPSVFVTSDDQGTIVDSGTTLAYLAEEAYDPFINAITSAVSQSLRSVLSEGSQCYQTTSSISAVFPTVSLNFAGNATMILNPEDYLIQQTSVVGSAVWCIGFQKIKGQGLTVLGDLVLKNKIIVYDLAGQRIGWANYDCSSSVNVSETTSSGKSQYLNWRQIRESSSSQNPPHRLIPMIFAALLLHASAFVTTSFL